VKRAGPAVLVAIGLLVVVAMVAGRALGGGDTPTVAPTTTARPATTQATTGTASDTAGGQAPSTAAPTAAPSRPAADPASPPPGPLSAAELIRAAAAASRFAVAYATYRFDEPPQAAADRLGGLATDEFAAELAHSSSAAAARTQQREVTVAQPTGVRLRLIAPDSVVAVVTVRQTVTSSAGHTTHLRQYAVTVVNVDRQWAASAIAGVDDGDTGG
jgi:hypothetical protein